jgi:hypothetical protein
VTGAKWDRAAIDAIIGTTTELRCDGGLGLRTTATAGHAAAAAIVADPVTRPVCLAHWREDNAERWFHKADTGTLAARDASGVWWRVAQYWDFDRDGYPSPAG